MNARLYGGPPLRVMHQGIQPREGFVFQTTLFYIYTRIKQFIPKASTHTAHPPLPPPPPLIFVLSEFNSAPLISSPPYPF